MNKRLQPWPFMLLMPLAVTFLACVSEEDAASSRTDADSAAGNGQDNEPDADTSAGGDAGQSAGGQNGGRNDAGTTGEADGSQDGGGIDIDAGEGTGRDAGDADAGAVPSDDAGNHSDAAMGSGEGGVVTMTLVPITAYDESAPVTTSHRVVALDAESGLPLVPAVETTSAQSTGRLHLVGIPANRLFNIYVAGVARVPEATSTYDTVVLNVRPETADTLLRIATQGTAPLFSQTGGFAPAADRAPVSGTVYWSRGGVRRGTVGCARLYIDDHTGNAASFDQRYVFVNRLPTTLDKLDRTLRTGSFYFGNVTRGQHTVRVSLDGGATFLAAGVRFTIGAVRSEAASPYKSVLYQLGIDIDTVANPTLASCPPDPNY